MTNTTATLTANQVITAPLDELLAISNAFIFPLDTDDPAHVGFACVVTDGSVALCIPTHWDAQNRDSVARIILGAYLYVALPMPSGLLFYRDDKDGLDCLSVVAGPTVTEARP